jgi:thermitase
MLKKCVKLVLFITIVALFLPINLVYAQESESRAQRNKKIQIPQWHLKNLNVEPAWKHSTGAGVNIADCGTGIDATNKELKNQINYDLAFDLAKNDKNSWQTIENIHSTYIAGIMVGAKGNYGITGIAYNAKIVPIKITMDSSGSVNSSKIAECIRYVADKGIRIVNVSYSNVANNQIIVDAANYAASKSTIVVYGAGNTNSKLEGENVSSILVASGIDFKNKKSELSSYGKYVDFAMPSQDIITTGEGGRYSSVSGTSYASPMLAATIALMLSIKPNISNEQVFEVLKSSAIDLGEKGYDEIYGSGTLNVARAVNLTKKL